MSSGSDDEGASVTSREREKSHKRSRKHKSRSPSGERSPHTYTESVECTHTHTHTHTFTVFMYSLKSLTLSASSVIVSNRGSLQNRGRTCTYNIKVEIPSLKMMQWYTVFLQLDNMATIVFAVHYCVATVRGWHSEPLILLLPIKIANYSRAMSI